MDCKWTHLHQSWVISSQLKSHLVTKRSVTGTGWGRPPCCTTSVTSHSLSSSKPHLSIYQVHICVQCLPPQERIDMILKNNHSSIVESQVIHPNCSAGKGTLWYLCLYLRLSLPIRLLVTGLNPLVLALHLSHNVISHQYQVTICLWAYHRVNTSKWIWFA